MITNKSYADLESQGSALKTERLSLNILNVHNTSGRSRVVCYYTITYFTSWVIDDRSSPTTGTCTANIHAIFPLSFHSHTQSTGSNDLDGVDGECVRSTADLRVVA